MTEAKAGSEQPEVGGGKTLAGRRLVVIAKQSKARLKVNGVPIDSEIVSGFTASDANGVQTKMDSRFRGNDDRDQETILTFCNAASLRTCTAPALVVIPAKAGIQFSR